MTVGQTIEFATAVKTPSDAMSNRQRKAEFRKNMTDFLLRSMGIAHTKDTKLGNEYIRGVSGGERKRVSIIEVLATRASVFCWDNSTRGQYSKRFRLCYSEAHWNHRSRRQYRSAMGSSRKDHHRCPGPHLDRNAISSR
jgi:hypothetical protein